MEGGDGNDGFGPNSTFQEPLDDTMDFDFVDELLFDGCWLETTDNGEELNFILSAPSSPVDPAQHLSLDMGMDTWSKDINQQVCPEGPPKNPSLFKEFQDVHQDVCPEGSESFGPEGAELGRRMWIGPRAHPNLSVKDRLMVAVEHLKDCMLDRDILVQIWVPTKRGGKQVLTTRNQPFSLLNPSCQRLVNYRGVSSVFQFPADGSKLSVGLPGLVFLEKLPEWTPDVRYFRKAEYPRIDFAHQYGVQGSIAVPVFQRGNSSCLGVVEFVTTSQKTNYRPELETVCRALEAVDLSSSHSYSPPEIKASCDSYDAAVPQMVEILTTICKEHKLPLAQTWAPCLQQGKDGCRHSSENYTFCVSTVDSARFVSNEDMLEFHEACSEYHLFQGQGLIGRALLTNKPIFASDVTAFTKTEYPLSHHARMFGLQAAAAIPLQSILAGLDNFVFEFFLPKDCLDIGKQKEILDSLSMNIQHTSQKFHAVTGKESEKQFRLPAWEIVIASDEAYDDGEIQKSVSSSSDFYSEEPSWISHTMEAQQKDKGISALAESQDEPNESSFTAICSSIQAELDQEQILTECVQPEQNAETKVTTEANQGSSINEHSSRSSKKSDERRRNKTEKTISLQVLQKYFAGSLKDAAKSLGVCPTTLKRICRQQGISRWPSRKIKKVDHSLKKLQRVMDSVQGSQGAIRIGTFYKSFPKLNSAYNSGNGPTSPSNRGNQSKQTNSQPDDGPGTQRATTSKHPPSPGSQSQSSDSTTCSTGAKHRSNARNGSTSGTKDSRGLLKRALSNEKLRFSNEEEPQTISRPQSHKLLSEDPNSLPKLDDKNLSDGSFRIKATFGDENVRFSLPVNSQFISLQKEIARRLNVEDFKGIGLRYLDDEGEWVLLTCDADLEECLVIHRLSQSQTIKLSVYHASKRDPFNTGAPLS